MCSMVSTSRKQRSLKDEVLELERYLRGCKEQGQRSLQELRNRPPPAAGADRFGSGHTPSQLQAEVEGLRTQNAKLLGQQHHLQQTLDAHAHDDTVSALQALQSKCSRLESELAAARTAALTSHGARGARAHHERGSDRSASATGASATDGAAVPVAMKEQITSMVAQIAQLKSDRDEIEGTVVSMYETLFSDNIVAGCVSAVRKKEIDLVASLEATGGSGAAGAAAGKKGAFAKPAPRLTAKLAEATERIDKLERELKNKAAEMDALDRHHQDNVKIAKIEAEALTEHFKVR